MVQHLRGLVSIFLNLGTLAVGREPGGGRARALAPLLLPGWGGESEGKPLPLALPLKLHVSTSPGHLSTIFLITPGVPALPLCTIVGEEGDL